MRSISQALLLALTATAAIACTDHNFHRNVHLKRASIEPEEIPYDISNDWGSLSPENLACQDGIMQAPLGLLDSMGFATTHAPTFTGWDRPSNGTFRNWGYGPAMDLAHPEGDLSALPSLTFDEAGTSETIHLIGWHIHNPSDHVVNGVRAKAEMHLVHANARGEPRAVVAVRMHPSSKTSTFLSSLPPMINFRDAATKSSEASITMGQALTEVDNFSQFWTYQGTLTPRFRSQEVGSLTYAGSLTTPPCSEGLRFFVAAQTLSMDTAQTRALLGSGRFSARVEQQVWMHKVNV